MIETSINDRKYRFEDGTSVLAACRSAGIEVPTLCHDERLKPIGSCRLCLMDIAGKPRPVPSCNTLLTEGMAISTHTPELENERRMILKMLAQDHSPDHPRNAPEKPFYSHAPAGNGITYQRLENHGVQWPCPDTDHPGTEVMHVDSFPMGKKTARPARWRAGADPKRLWLGFAANPDYFACKIGRVVCNLSRHRSVSQPGHQPSSRSLREESGIQSEPL